MSIKKHKKKIIISLIVIIVIVITSIFVFGSDEVEYVTEDLQKQDLIQTVSEIGSVVSSKEINLSFSQAGRLQNLNVKVGDEVEAGDVLAELDYTSLEIRRNEAEAALSVANSNLDKLVSGASSQDIKVAEAQVSQARSSYESALRDLEQVEKINTENIAQAEKNLNDLKSNNTSNPLPIRQAVDSARLNLDNTIKNNDQNVKNAYQSLINSLDYNLSLGMAALDSIDRIVEDDAIENVFSVKNSVYKTQTENLYNSALQQYSEAEVLIENLKTENNHNLANEASSSLSVFLNTTFQALNATFNGLDSTITSASFSQSALDNFKSTISSQKALINTAINSNSNARSSLDSAIVAANTSLTAAEDAFRQAEINLSDAIRRAENSLSSLMLSSDQQLLMAQSKLDASFNAYEISQAQLDKLKSPARSEDLRLAQAQVRQAQSSLEAVSQQISESILTAPISGRVVRVNFDTGEQIMLGTPAIVLLTENDYEIELFISETDIAKLKLGNQAEIEFDAFGMDYMLNGELYFIEPAATSISDVIYYKTKIIFSAEQAIEDGFDIKPGMTSTVTIITNKKENVFALPFRSIVREDERSFVRVLDSASDIREVDVQTGILADQAMVEIISDELKEGDTIIISTRN